MVIYLEDAFFTVKERRHGDISGENELRVEEGSTFARNAILFLLLQANAGSISTLLNKFS